MKTLTIASAVVGAVVCANCFVEAAETNSTSMSIEWEQISSKAGAASALLPKVETLWPDQPVQYFETEKKIGNILGGFSEDPAARQSLVGLFTNVVRKPFPTSSGQVVTFVELERDFVFDGLKFEAIRTDRVAYDAIAHLLGEIRSRERPNYSNRGTSLPGREILIKAGVMDPNLLKDPILKQQYEQAVEQNKQDLAMNSLQASLIESDEILVFHLLNARVLIPPHDAADANFFKALSKTAHLTADEQLQITN
jgi:hypothetical protein